MSLLGDILEILRFLETDFAFAVGIRWLCAIAELRNTAMKGWPPSLLEEN